MDWIDEDLDDIRDLYRTNTLFKWSMNFMNFLTYLY